MAARLLARAPCTEAELESRLVAKGYRPATAATTLARCRELGYVGDAGFARDRARTLRARGAGCLKIIADLTARGLPGTLVEEAVAEASEGVPEAEWARRALTGVPHAQAARAWRLLASRGFPEDVIVDLLGEGG